MTIEELARQRGGCGEVINVDALHDGNSVPSTAGLCDSPAKHREHNEARGVWVVYGLDHSQHWSTTVFTDELDARRYAMRNDLDAGFLRYGEPLEKVEQQA